jgi:hypothetical protein
MIRNATTIEPPLHTQPNPKKKKIRTGHICFDQQAVTCTSNVPARVNFDCANDTLNVIVDSLSQPSSPNSANGGNVSVDVKSTLAGAYCTAMNIAASTL